MTYTEMRIDVDGLIDAIDGCRRVEMNTRWSERLQDVSRLKDIIEKQDNGPYRLPPDYPYRPYPPVPKFPYNPLHPIGDPFLPPQILFTFTTDRTCVDPRNGAIH